jgi:hypothetical protein
MIAPMDEPRQCVCGCGREVPRRVESSNLLAIRLIPELTAWDRYRVDVRAGNAPPESPIRPEKLDGFLAEGGEHYQRAIAAVHGGTAVLGSGFSVNRWLRYSRKSRRKLDKLAPGAIVSDRAPALTEADLERLDRQHPERTYTG